MNKTDSTITQAILKEWLHYDPETGIFTWLKSTKFRKVLGKRAGCVSVNGYRVIGINRNPHYEHRLVWLYLYGEWPKQSIDHIDTDRGNNRRVNLRDVPHQMNIQNVQKPNKQNTSGFLGVVKNRKKWVAQIEAQGKRRYLGIFATKEQAYECYLENKRKFHLGNLL